MKMLLKKVFVKIQLSSTLLVPYDNSPWDILEHKDSIGESENLSKIFFGEILVFDHDYEGILSSSNDLLWITFIYF